ncbi:hypothetical protein B0H10DRAFT_1979609 [Mycena sp. CBHHK59/15]|nr:hypothetical protein B0H10DRAFT_1979609 [Mycena sp. CBHHK59/15]
MSTLTMTQFQVTARRSRGRARSLTLVASRTTPLLEIPTELGFEIIELAITQTPFSVLASVSKAFNALVSSIIYKTVIIDSVQTMSLFYRTVKIHIKTLAITLEPERFTLAKRIELEEIIASCKGLRTLALPRPGVLAATLSPTHRTTHCPAKHCLHAAPLERPAAHLSASLTHLRICEPGEAWHAPLSVLEFFGGLPHLTHLAWRLCALLVSRPKLKMLIVSIFPAHWPYYFDQMTPRRLADSRLVLLAARIDGSKEASWACVSSTARGSQPRHRSFWEDLN